MTATAHFYTDKVADYFSGARADMVALLPDNPDANILELGCGDGSTGALALQARKSGHYLGIELDPTAAELARMKLSDVLIGDAAALDLSEYLARFDALIASEVFEHLVDPWTVLNKLTLCLKDDALVYASSPNIAHWRVIYGLLRGRFTHTESGVMDQSHLRWFTPQSYSTLFESAGLEVISVRAITPPALRTRLLNRITRGRFAHLFMTQIMIIARKVR